MLPSNEFTGLTMPAFTAFGWAGEENALKFALSQLEQFINALHGRLSTEARDEFPFHGLSLENQNVYLSADEEYAQNTYVAFNARPISLEILLTVEDPAALAKGLAEIKKDPAAAYDVLAQLDPNWTIRVQQMQVDPETGERAHHLDLHRDTIGNLTAEQLAEVVDRAAYLNGDGKWVTPVYLSLRLASERVAAMGTTVLDVSNGLVEGLVPVSRLFTGHEPRKSGASRAARAKAARKAAEREAALQNGADTGTITSTRKIGDEFTYVAELKPLHIRRGFINLTPGHWPFFSQSTRTETRDVTVFYGPEQKAKSTVWRLQPDDQARLVLSKPVHAWLEENFSTSDSIRVSARRLDNDEIRITLEADV